MASASRSAATQDLWRRQAVSEKAKNGETALDTPGGTRNCRLGILWWPVPPDGARLRNRYCRAGTVEEVASEVGVDV